MSEALLLLLLIVLSMNLVLGLWFAFKSQQVPVVAAPIKKKVVEEKEEKQEWAPGWVGRAGPPPELVIASGHQLPVIEEYEPDAYMSSRMGYSPLF
jgi:hypothetical protein